MEKDQEIKNLAKEIEAKEQVLKQEGEPIEEKEIVKEVLKEKIENYLETKPETPSAIKPEQPSYSKKEPLPTAPLIDEKLAETGEIKELIDLALEKGLKTAIKQAEKSSNPYLIDQLHDLLAGPYYETLKKKKLI
jgi:hypothetical protein